MSGRGRDYLERLIAIRGGGLAGNGHNHKMSILLQSRKILVLFILSFVILQPGYLEAVMLSGDDEGFQAQGCPSQLLFERAQLPLLPLAATLQPLNLSDVKKRGNN